MHRDWERQVASARAFAADLLALFDLQERAAALEPARAVAGALGLPPGRRGGRSG